VSVGGDKNVLLWDVAQAKVLRRWEGHAGRINACAWGGDGREDGIVASGMLEIISQLIFTCLMDIWKTLDCKLTIYRTGGFDTSIKLWDAKSNSSKALMSLSEAKDGISCIEIVGEEIFAGSVDGRVRVYDIRMGRVSVDVIGRKL
jgi:mitogen-activated protein kinase organizer 1